MIDRRAQRDSSISIFRIIAVAEDMGEEFGAYLKTLDI